MIMGCLQIGSKLIAKTDCAMRDGSGSALISGKVYDVIYHSKNTEEVAIKSELFAHHFFSIKSGHHSYWKKYFDLLT